MNAHLDYLLAGYGISIALWVGYLVWLTLRQKRLEHRLRELVEQGATLPTFLREEESDPSTTISAGPSDPAH